MQLEIHQFPCLSDNYGYLIHDAESGQTASIDSPDADRINQALKEKGWSLTHILNTHHHYDHTGANMALRDRWRCTIVGAAGDADRIPGIGVRLCEGDEYPFGGHKARILDVSGHTIGHIAYYFAESQALFCGDALFSLGCGRLFEGSPATMWESLGKICALPDETRVYCAHEYTQANARFAVTVEPGNQALLARVREIDELRARQAPTVPSTLGLEKATNPFLRPDSPELQKTLAMQGADLVSIFAETRRRKDSF